MAKYDIYESPQPPDKGAKNKHHVRLVPIGNVSTRKLAERIQRSCSLTVADVEGVLIALSREMTALLADGERIHIDGLGYFQMTLSCDIPEEEKKIRSEYVHFKSVSFRPESSLKKALSSTLFTRTQRKKHSGTFSLEDIREKLIAHFEKKDYMTRAEFERLSGFRHTTAYRRLKKLVEEGILIKRGPLHFPIYELANK
ncbi:MAG: DNA-binding protein [Candidatus Azobacteroides sp.]|nr:DNA-binding protein [Candidatus Azobacteroides sp.]